MVVLNRIYTRTGDDGTTALGSGERRKKYDLRVSAYGTLDEVNAVLGLPRLHTGADRALDAVLARIQNDLFDVEADLCLSAKGPGGARMTITDQIPQITAAIDAGRPAALGLVTVRSMNPGDLGRCHQVLAYRYEWDGAYFRLGVYDPNRPNAGTMRVRRSSPMA